ncbi:hypothetical protein G647_05639 [Cladophialophora carrionii CBS 160.54]|uniref:C3H1-type domain-containing protein n=1 Tax=Cladophialophora carrionii CBS 160.54 TaxID=1279043 RepID=V9DBZ1_9EURO|nr:uncharacterized protein G647_05639 [Cladophialophora carrionii CBS 160.54]ETI23833.1 hypothetical protein G647_05639 [Cladophialophora carrionii CBS 160.54]
MSESSLPPPSKAPAGAPKGPKKLRFSTMPPRSYLQPTPSPWTRNRAPSPANQRQSSSPLVHSPLQKSFEPDMSKSEPSSPQSMTTQETPSRRSRLGGHAAGPRGESRSSSVPMVIRTPQGAEDESDGPGQDSLRSRSGPASRATSPMPSPVGNQNDQDRRSVKHLTCFWWWEKGECKYSDDECLYAHYDTGHYTAAPRQVVPGEPAKAGKSLERALTKLALTNRSSASLASLGTFNGNTTERDNLSVGSGALSRPETPFSSRSRPGTPSPRGSVDFGYAAQLRNDNDFLRGLVQQTQREKRALMDTIEGLQSEKSQLTAQLGNMKEERTTLLEEREALQATIKTMQFPTGVNPYTQQSLAVPARSPNTGIFPAQNPWGPIGSSRGNGSSRPNTPAGTPAATPSPQLRSFTYPAIGSFGPVGSVPSPNGLGINGMNDFPPSTLNPSAASYGSGIRMPAQVSAATATQPENDFGGNGADGERLQNVLRHLGPSF